MKIKKLLFLLPLLFIFSPAVLAQDDLVNASYALSKDLFTEYNQLFKTYWKDKTGKQIELSVINDASSTQVQNISRGLKADVVTFNQASDIDKLVSAGFVARDWREKFPNQSVPYYSTIAFVVRKGNPENIKDWSDLIRPKVSFIFPNPKTSGNGRYSVIAALAYAQDNFSEPKEQEEFMQKWVLHMATISEGGRKTTEKFVSSKLIDALLTFEAEANSIKENYANEEFEVIVPKSSILAEFPVSIVDKVVEAEGSKTVAEEYLNHMYSEEIQEFLASKFHYRVNNKKVMEKYADKFPKLELKDPQKLGNWSEIMKTYFSKGGKWDKFMGE